MKANNFLADSQEPIYLLPVRAGIVGIGFQKVQSAFMWAGKDKGNVLTHFIPGETFFLDPRDVLKLDSSNDCTSAGISSSPKHKSINELGAPASRPSVLAEIQAATSEASMAPDTAFHFDMSTSNYDGPQSEDEYLVDAIQAHFCNRNVAMKTADGHIFQACESCYEAHEALTDCGRALMPDFDGSDPEHRKQLPNATPVHQLPASTYTPAA